MATIAATPAPPFLPTTVAVPSSHRPRRRESPRTRLAIAICTKNNIRTIRRTLESVRDLADRIVIVDSGSTDGTTEIGRALGAEIHHREWNGPVAQKQYAMDLCADADWVLLLDSDESPEPDLRESIRAVLREADDDDDPAGPIAYEINRRVWFLGGWLKHAFQPEWRTRLVRGGHARLEGVGENGLGGHDRIEVDGRVDRLDGVCRHDSWTDLREMFTRYAALAERAAAYDPRGGRVIDILFRPVVAIVKQLFVRRAILDGRRGLIASFGCGAGVLMKHLCIMERRAELGHWARRAE